MYIHICVSNSKIDIYVYIHKINCVWNVDVYGISSIMILNDMEFTYSTLLEIDTRTTYSYCMWTSGATDASLPNDGDHSRNLGHQDFRSKAVTKWKATQNLALSTGKPLYTNLYRL